MTSGGLSKTEAWNLQLRARVRTLEIELEKVAKRYHREGTPWGKRESIRIRLVIKPPKDPAIERILNDH